MLGLANKSFFKGALKAGVLTCPLGETCGSSSPPLSGPFNGPNPPSKCPYVISAGRVGYLEAEVDAWRASRGRRSAAQTTPTPEVEGPSAAEPRPRDLVVVPRGRATSAQIDCDF